jgi:hypothetical protein
MDIVIKNVASKDVKFVNELAKRLGLKTAELSADKKEDIALAAIIRKGLDSGFVDGRDVLKTLRKAQGKK